MVSVYEPKVKNAALFLLMIGYVCYKGTGGTDLPGFLMVITSGLFVLWSLKNFLFRYTVEIGENGLRVTDHFRTRTLFWDDIRDVRYKGASVSNGYTFSTKLIFKTSGEPIVLDGHLSDFEELAGLIEKRMLKETEFSIEAAKERQGLMGFVGGASVEDFPEAIVDHLVTAVTIFCILI